MTTGKQPLKSRVQAQPKAQPKVAWSDTGDSGVDMIAASLKAAKIAPSDQISAKIFATVFGTILTKLRADIAAAAGGLKFAGVWQRAQSYGKGNVVTHEGSAWVALKDVPEGSRPAYDLDSWQLMVKAGRDGR